MGARRKDKRARVFADRVSRAAVRLALYEMEASYEPGARGNIFLELLDVTGSENTAIVNISVRVPSASDSEGPWFDEVRGSFAVDLSSLRAKAGGWDWNALRRHLLEQVVETLELMKVPVPRRVKKELSEKGGGSS